MSHTEKELLARIADLQSEIKKIKNRKKYGLVWEDKPEDVVLQCETNIPILKEVKTRKVVSDNALPTNILIEGDNYHSLSVLNYTHREKVDAIFLDPPYNTGSNTWKYNNDYVDKEDAFRHSKWISFMSKRLTLAKNLLKENGVLILTIDDYEIFSIGLLLDEIFGEVNRLNVLIVENNPRGRTSNAFFATSHEYYLYYSKNSDKASLANIPLTPEQVDAFGLEDEISKYRLLPLRKSGADSRRPDRPKQFYPIYINSLNLKLSLEKKNGWFELWPIDSDGEERVWKLGRDSCERLIKTGDIIVKERGDTFVLSQKDRLKEGRKPKTVWVNPKYDASAHGTILIANILNQRDSFDYPKSLYAMIDSLFPVVKENKNAIILDFFAGSGTTGHAVMELNKQDGGNRKFILCTNNENKICEEVTYERIKRVMKGYKNKKGEKVEGLGGNLSYFKTDLVSVDKLRRISDESKIKVTYQAGEMIALREDTLNEIERNDWWQIFEGNGKLTAIYFTENKTKLKELMKILEKKKLPTTLYIFGWGKNEYKNDYSTRSIRVEDIPEPILEVYKEINRI